jgi:hypothetical protein
LACSFALYLSAAYHFSFGIKSAKSKLQKYDESAECVRAAKALNLPVSDIIPAKFSIHRWQIVVFFSREKTKDLRLRSMCAVNVKPDNRINIFGKFYSHIVFPARVTDDFKIEQTASGFPCVNEGQANQIVRVIEERNHAPQVVLVSAHGFFTLATFRTEISCERLNLFQFPVPVTKYGITYGFALRLWKYSIDSPRELISEDLLPTTDYKTAEKIMRDKDMESALTKSLDAKSSSIAAPAVEPALIQSQLLFLSKSYPETVGFLKNPKAGNADAAYAAYQRETLVVTGQLDGTLDKDQYKQTARQLENASRRKLPEQNPVEYELIANWKLRGYDAMTPDERFNNLKRLGFEPVSPEAIRKTCERLKLPTKNRNDSEALQVNK